MRKFHLVDFAAHYQKGFRNHIVPIAEVPELMRAFDYYGCYATYFFYTEEVLTYMSAQAKETAPTIAGYEGRVWAPYLPIDLDHPELSPALDSARRLVSLFIENWRIDAGALQIYFSGSKGFHLMLDTRLFGRVPPAKNLPQIFDSLRRHFAQELRESLRETVDLTIKDRVRLLRLPNTVHEKSKLRKVILGLGEIQSLSPDEIRARARNPRPLTLTDESGLVSKVEVSENPEARRLFERVRRQLRQFTRKPFDYRFQRPPDLDRLEFPCAGIQAIWHSQIQPGQRNNCAIRLASELRLLGLTAEEAENKLLQWNEKNRLELSVDELRAVARSAYQRRFPYRYSCRDVILRSFCPLANYDACRAFVARHGERL